MAYAPLEHAHATKESMPISHRLRLVAPVLVLASAIASAAAPATLEERLEKLEREQKAMQEQLEEKDARIRELEAERAADDARAAEVDEASDAAGATPATAPADAEPAAESSAAPTTAEPAAGEEDAAEDATGAADARKAKIEEAAEIAKQPTWGDMSPGNGFKIASTGLGDLSISGYGLLRYLNQLPGNQNFDDSLGVKHEVDTRQDFNLHRVLIHFLGWAYDPKLRYALSVWTVNATEQVRVVGNLGYRFNEHLNFAGGIGATPGTRSLLGSHPYWLANDRVMADEYFRPGFSAGVWAEGLAIPTLYYKFMIGNNISQLGVGANELTRDLAYSGSLWWMPTTGEFGPKGAYGDWEWHDEVATRFGVSGTYSQEDRAAQLSQRGPDTTQIRVGDSLLLFEQDALAIGATVQRAEYKLLAADAGLKYKGFFLQAEYYYRTLDNFHTNAPVPVDEIIDHGFYIQAAFFPIRKLLELYASTSWIFADDSAGYDTSQEYVVGSNIYPFNTRNARVNVQANFIEDSPVSSSFGFYQGGLDGVTLSAALSVFF